MKSIRILPLLSAAIISVFAASCSGDPEVRAAKALVKRLAPAEASQFSFIRTEDTVQRFTLSAERGKVRIAAPDANCMAVGLNYYLKNWCEVTVSWYAADEVRLPASLPLPQEPLTVSARVGERFFLNYCI